MLMAVDETPQALVAAAPQGARAPASPLELRAQAGDRRAIEELLRSHASLLLGICQHIVGGTDARDALQESLERVVRQMSRFSTEHGSFRGWASTVTRNVCRDRLKRRGLERAAFSQHDGDEQTQAAPNHEPDPERQAMARQGASQLERALAGLPEEMRTALVMFHMHDASYEEIARALEVPMGTVMTWLHRGRLRLRSAVEEP
jgi:RNA polymerase sigma-70 factor (ECF subfamily)